MPFVVSVGAAATLFLLLALLGALTDWWWSDEAYTWDMVQRPIPEMVARAAADVHPPLYYLALAGWHRLLPQPRAMKGLSLLAGLGALLAVAMAGRLLRGRRLGSLLALLWATFPLFLHYSADARMYAMALCLESFAVAGWVLSARHPRRGWIIFVSALSASLYTQNLCLFFAAALIGGEVCRCLLANRRGAPKAVRGTGLAWILSAALAIGVCYAPWTLVLRHQIQNQALLHFFHAPTWSEIIHKTILIPYTLALTGQDHAGAWWLPGATVLVALPALWLLGEARRLARPGQSLEARPVLLLAWVGLGPFLFLVLYSRLVNPMFEINRHGVLFIPFLLFPAAAWLEEHSRRLPARLLALGLIGVTGACALGALSRARHTDLRVHRDAVMDRAPLGAPIVMYPPLYQYSRLMWSPLPVLLGEADQREKIAKVTSCTLVVHTDGSPLRDEIKRLGQQTIAQAAMVREIYTSYDATAYYLAGLPAGAIDALLRRKPGSGADMIGSLAGRWSPKPVWGAADVLKFCRPQGELYSFAPSQPSWGGARLTETRTTLSLPLASTQKYALGALMAGGHFISAGKAARLQTRLNNGRPVALDLKTNDFLISRFIALPAAAKDLVLEIPETLARRQYTPHGDVPPGVYLTWAGFRGLDANEFRMPGFKGEYFDVGGLGDELYLRAGFHEAEGTPPAAVRWTTSRFALEVPVWPGDRFREVALFGTLPEAVRDRWIGVEVTNLATGRIFQARAKFEKKDFGSYVLPLPEFLETGIYQLAFTVGVWSPGAQGSGGDSRELGFFLKGVGLPAAP